MPYERKLIDGTLMERSTQGGQWHVCDPMTCGEYIDKLESENSRLESILSLKVSNQSYFYEALMQVSGNIPPAFMARVTTSEYLSNFDDKKNDELHNWAVDSSALPWSTGMGIIEAAIQLVKDAADNGNIPMSEIKES